MIEKLGRVSFRLKHHDEKLKAWHMVLTLTPGYTSKTDFILWENAENGALKQDTSTVSMIHGTFLAIDPFISYYNTGKMKHDLKDQITII